ncbi:MAG: DUF4105 domain-containing protein [bacterium]|nr:DUF4105 domain-containing protein [bacterium]
MKSLRDRISRSQLQDSNFRYSLSLTLVFAFVVFAGVFPLRGQDDTPQTDPATTADAQVAVESEFLEFARQLVAASNTDFNVELVTVGPGATPTNAFGHSALRIVSGQELGAQDYMVDFGQYDESFGFLWRFLRGEARFFVHVLPTAWAVNAWDSAARGMVTTRLKLSGPQKTKLLKAVAEQVAEREQGYEYDNFHNNCVTYIRDLIGLATDTRLSLDAFDDRRVDPAIFEGEQDTWRGRTFVWSNENFWLFVSENLLFDPDTDLKRKGDELIFMPDDLLLAVQQAGLEGQVRVLVPHRHAHNPAVLFRYGRIFESNILQRLFPPQLNQFSSPGYRSKIVLSGVMIIIVVLMLPISSLARYRLWGERSYAIIFGIAAIYATLIRFGTLFHFMDGTLIPFFFFPLDILLFWNTAKAKDPERWRRRKFWYALVRIFMILLGLIFAGFVWPQAVLDLGFFALIFFALYAWNHRPAAAQSDLNRGTL